MRHLAEMFNGFDPSPSRERDPDDEAEGFIVAWARDLPAHEPGDGDASSDVAAAAFAAHPAPDAAEEPVSRRVAQI